MSMSLRGSARSKAIQQSEAIPIGVASIKLDLMLIERVNRMNSTELTNYIKMKATEIGFDLIGITDSKNHLYSDFLRQWVHRKFSAEMQWIRNSIAKRLDIAKVMKECESIIVVGENYYRKKDDHYYGQIARYAASTDYHKRMKKKLLLLGENLKQVTDDCRYKVYVDSGPVMEKLWAMKAGIGWMGKHTLIINSLLGSWLCFGVVLLNKELIYDQPVRALCGNCTKCMDACPTGAITAPYVLDASRCVSYLNQYTAEIPRHFQDSLQGYFFGCDICQEVCPWNKHAILCTMPDKSLPVTYSREELLELLLLTQQDFILRFGGYPVSKIKLAGLIKNINCILSGSNT